MIRNRKAMNKYDPLSDPSGDVRYCKICDSPLEYDPFNKEWICKNCENGDTCPDCDGSGEMACEGWYNLDGMMTCERCNGKGKI